VSVRLFELCLISLPLAPINPFHVSMSLRNILSGTGVALVTPFAADGSVDFPSLGNIIDFVIAGKVEYVVTLGTTGETPTLSRDEKIGIITFTYERVKGRVPVVVGIGGNNTHELLADLKEFPLADATAILSASPYYSKPSQEGIYQHYKAFAAASPKPVLLYNVPGRSGRNVAASTTLRLAREVENIAGIKEASGDMAQCQLILRDRPIDFLVASGDDALAMAQVAVGMDGVISVAANAFPKEFSEMIRLSLKHSLVGAKQMNDYLIAAYELMFVENNPAGVKAFMNEKGLLKNILRLPMTSLSEVYHQQVREFLAKS
jgi:4-hydroxy-tetrahydrodipicolinate synthase